MKEKELQETGKPVQKFILIAAESEGAPITAEA